MTLKREGTKAKPEFSRAQDEKESALNGRVKDTKAEKRARDDSDKCYCRSSLADTGRFICCIHKSSSESRIRREGKRIMT